MSMSFSEKVIQKCIVAFLIILSGIALIPLISVLSVSFSSRVPVELNQVTIWPKGFTLDSWKYVLDRPDLWRSFGVTAVATIVGTVLSLLITALMAYPLTKKSLR